MVKSATRRLAPALGFLIIPFTIVLPAATSAPSQTGTSSAAPISVRVQGAPRVPRGAVTLGAMASTATISGAVALAPRDEDALQAFISNVTDKSSPQYGQYLAPGAFDAQFGPSASTVTAVEQAVEADGLQVSGVSSDGLLVDFSGTVRQAETTFGTNINSYRMPGGWTGRGTTGAVDLQLPATLSSAVAGVIGLDNLVQPETANATPGTPAPGQSFPAAKQEPVPSVPGAPSPCVDAQQAATTEGGLTDDQIANAYGAFGLYERGDFGQGQHVAIYELQPFLATDIETFDTCYFGAAEGAEMSGTDGNLAGSRLSVIPVDGGELQPGPGSENDEATLDVEDVSAMAPEADIDAYEAPNTGFGLIDEYAQIIDSDTDQLMTTSWDIGCEQLAQFVAPGIPEVQNFLYQQAAAQGQTVLAASFDTGDDSCNTERIVPVPAGQNLLSTADTASQPYALAVGGTTITDATQPPVQQVWNDGANWGGAGGGVSEAWTMPAWQQRLALNAANTTDVNNGETVESEYAAEEAPFATPTFCDGTLGLSPGTPCREVPDVSAEADEFTGAVTIYGQSLGYGPANGWTTIGGTSSATPIWAAMLALVNASKYCSADLVSFANGKAQDTGFASPILYGVAANSKAYAASFTNVTVGNNDLYGLDNGLVYPARPGYNMAAGLGSPELASPSGGPGLAFYMCQYAATLAPPTVTSLTPSFGPLTGDAVTISGSGFEDSSGVADVADVEVGGGTATSFTVLSKDKLTASFPPAASTIPVGSPNPTQDGAGPADVVVVLTNGQSSLPGAGAVFDFVDETSSPVSTIPSVTGVSPFGGLDTSPATVTIFGSGFVSPGSADTVDFGGVPATSVTYVSPFELTASPPAFSALTPATACPMDNGATGQPLNPAQDICQVEVTVVTVDGNTSETATPLPPYEGPEVYDNMGGEVLPPGCGCEDEPQPDEYDYVPLPTITSVSTVLSNPASLASEYGGATSNTVVVQGTGMDPLTVTAALFGTPLNENSVNYDFVQLSGTSMVFEAPPLIAPNASPTTGPEGVTIGFASISGNSTEDGTVEYAGVPVTTSVVNSANSLTLDGLSGAVDTGGAPLTLEGAGFSEAVAPLYFEETTTETDLATQYSYDVVSDSEVTAESVSMNPDTVDVYLCSNTGCDPNPPDDQLIVYPPGNPVVTSVAPSTGSPLGGTAVVISGQNLGCAVSVSFGKVVAESFANEPALLDCGTTNLVDATSPPGTPATAVPVTVVTAESYFTGVTGTSGATFSYSGAPGSPLITSAGSATGDVGTLLSFTVTTLGQAPIELSESGPLPGGVRFTPGPGGTALVQGTPQPGTAGVYYFNITAVNRAGTLTQPFVLTVDLSPQLSGPSGQRIPLGAPATIVITSVGFPTPALSVTVGTLPAGLNASDGTDGSLVISGTPEPGSQGTYPLTISATSTSGSTTKDLTIAVRS